MTLSATELFRTLRDESLSTAIKVEAAGQAWEEATKGGGHVEFKRNFLLDWLLGRLLKGKDAESSGLQFPKCWQLLDSLTRAMSAEQLGAALSKTPTLPIFQSFILSSQQLSTTASTAVWLRFLRLAAERASADSVMTSLEIVYEVAAARQDNEVRLVEEACECFSAALALASAAVHKKLLHTFLGKPLHHLISVLADAARPDQLKTALLRPLSTVLLSHAQLHKMLSSPTKADVDLIPALRQLPPADLRQALPRLFDLYIHSVKAYLPTFGAASPSSRSAQEAQSTLLLRTSAFACLKDISTDGSLYDVHSAAALLRLIQQHHLYAPTIGHSDAWKATLDLLLSAALRSEKHPAQAEACCCLVRIEPVLADARLVEILQTVDPSAELSAQLREYYTRTRRLPDYLEALIKSSQDGFLLAGERPSLAIALSLSLPPSQALALVQDSLSKAMAVLGDKREASPPPTKKRRKSSSSASTSDAAVDAASLVLEAVDAPFSDQAGLATQISDAFKQFSSQAEHSATSLQLLTACLGWMLRHESSMASRWDDMQDALEQSAQAAKHVLNTSSSTHLAHYYATMLAFYLAGTQHSDAVAAAVDHIYESVSSKKFTGSVTADARDKRSLATASWMALLQFSAAVEDCISEAQRDRFALLLVDHFYSSQVNVQQVAADYLRSSNFSSCKFLRDATMRKLSAVVQQDKSKSSSVKLLQLSSAVLSSALRKEAIATCEGSLPADAQVAAQAFLVSHVQSGGALPESIDPALADKVAQIMHKQDVKQTRIFSIASKEAVDQACRLIVAAVEQDLIMEQRHTTKHLKTLAVIISQAPSGCKRSVSNCLSSTLRILNAALLDRQVSSVASSTLTEDVCAFIAGALASQSCLVNHNDVAIILAMFQLLLQPSPQAQTSARGQQIFAHIVSALSTLVRHRKDIIVSLFPALMQVVATTLQLLRPFADSSAHLPAWTKSCTTEADLAERARLYGRLLTNMTAKTVQQKTAASSRQVSSLHGALSKHAGYFLLAYLRACAAKQAPLAPSTRAELSAGINEVISTMNKYERDALMNGLLTVRDDAERVMLRQMWKDYERLRYKGEA